MSHKKRETNHIYWELEEDIKIHTDCASEFWNISSKKCEGHLLLGIRGLSYVLSEYRDVTLFWRCSTTKHAIRSKVHPLPFDNNIEHFLTWVNSELGYDKETKTSKSTNFWDHIKLKT